MIIFGKQAGIFTVKASGVLVMFYFLIKGKLHRCVHFVKVKLLKIYGASVFSVSVCISDIYISCT